MAGLFGRQHPSKPITTEDREMSRRHLATRARFAGARPSPANLRRSIAYNQAHAKEHTKAIEDRREQLDDAREERAKLVEKLAKERSR